MTAKSSPSNSYLKYAGMAFQLFILIGIGAWLGQKTDEVLSTPEPYFTILFILLFTGVFFYKLIKDLSQKNEP